jgi:hypothetical protein
MHHDVRDHDDLRSHWNKKKNRSTAIGNPHIREEPFNIVLQLSLRTTEVLRQPFPGLLFKIPVGRGKKIQNKK